MTPKRRNLLQNLAMLLLTFSALFLLSRLAVFSNMWKDTFQTLHAIGTEDTEETELQGAFASMGLMVANGSGRFGQLCATADTPLLQQAAPLFREALGSASAAGTVPDLTLRTALDDCSIYLEFASELPLDAVAVWLGEEEPASQRDVCAMALTTGGNGSAMLYLRSESDTIFLYDTALPASAVENLCRSSTPNGSMFAYETNYAALDPYTILASEPDTLSSLHSGLPEGYSAYNLLTALDFNAHTSYRYAESGGAEVVNDAPRTLRISPDGTVDYTTGVGEVDSPLYHLEQAGETLTLKEVLRAAVRLADTLTAGTVASPLYVRAVEETEDGWEISFRYQWEGIPIHFSGDPDALTITIRGSEITSFVYRCRLYTNAGSYDTLLPSSLAISIASLYPGAGLRLGYNDTGGDTLQPQWLDR